MTTQSRGRGTRRLNNKRGIEDYIRKLEAVGPNRTGTFTSDSLLGVGEKDTKATNRAAVVMKRAPRISSYLIPRTFKCGLSVPRIREILAELQSLQVPKFENSAAILLRIFIELSIYHYLEANGTLKTLIARIDKAGKKPKTWSPTLRQMLNELLENDPAVDLPPQMRKALRKAVADDDYPLSLDGMDQFAHNAYIAPTEKQLRQLWSAFEKLMAFLMIDHSKAVLAQKAGR